jgi:hypothetical protein
MMLRIAWRSLVTRPVRTVVLAAGFGFGIAVMAELLGVGHVMLEQAHSPALQGGGDIVVTGALGSIQSARFVMLNVLGATDLAGRVGVVSPAKEARLFLMTARGPIELSARGGIPSLEKAVGDPEVSGIDSWTDRPGDSRWSSASPSDVLRAMDRFHPIPDVPRHRSSWAEWLYFNGRTRDGRTRIYLTFLAGPPAPTPGRRVAGVRLQLERDGRSTNYSARGEVDEVSLLANAPDLEIAGNRVRLDGLSYHLTLALDGAGDPAHAARLTGDIVLDAAPGRSLPPSAIHGANGWVSGYTVPALAGTFRGSLNTTGVSADEMIPLDDAVGYHDHNWGFWEGVSWQWGQVAHDDLSIVFGRVFPPADVADADHIPGFMTVLGPQGPLAFSTDVAIDDHDLGHVAVRARGRGIDLRLTLTVEETTRTSMAMARLPTGPPMNFLQLGGSYRVTGRVGERNVDFVARGSAEAFRPQ